jgi:hypothetical protein
MAYDVTNFTDYVARANEFLTATLFAGGDTGKFARFMAGVKGKTSVPHIGTSATLQAGNCKTPSGDTDITEVFIEVKPFTVFEGFCEDDLQTKFPNMVLAPGSSNNDAPAGWEEKIVETKVSAIQETLELTYWQGDTGGTYTLFDGFIKLIDASGVAIDGNTSAATTITKANVIDLVDAMYVASPAKVKRSGELVIAVGDDVFDLYIAAQKAANLYHYDAEHDNGVLKIGGSRGTLQRIYGLDGTDRMFAGRGSSFVVGSDVTEEENIMKIWYDETDDKVYMRSKGKAGVTIVNPEEIVEFTLSV